MSQLLDYISLCDECLNTSTNSFYRFTYVRHPFERLVSAYVEKFELAYITNWVYRSKKNKKSLI